MSTFPKIFLILAFILLILPQEIFSAPLSDLKKEQQNSREKISPPQQRTITELHYATIHSTINPATFHYLKDLTKSLTQDLEKAKESLLIVEMDTPGGLVTTTKDILTLMGSSPLPFVVWVHPEGGSATSAGALIAAGAHLIFMSEGTNIGAATPIEMSGNIGGKNSDQSDLRAKAINDLVALVKGLSHLRHRNPQGFSEMITKAKSFTAREAQEEKLINGIANNKRELLSQLQSRKIKLQGETLQLHISKNIREVTHPMDPGQKLLNILAHPSLAYIFFLLGAALIYLELQAPGGFIAGSIGALCLILSGIGLQVLPLNFGALGLIVLSFILFALEVFITSFGLLSIAGLTSLIFGSLFLYRTQDSYLSFSTSLVFACVLAIGSFLCLCLFIILKDQKKKRESGPQKFNSLLGKEGIVVKEIRNSPGHYLYQIKIASEFWRANSENPKAIGSTAIVTKCPKNELILTIK